MRVEHRRGAIRVKLRPQARDMDLDDIGAWVEPQPPYRRQEFALPHCTPGVFGEMDEQRIFARQQVEHAAVARGGARDTVDVEAAQPQRGAGRRAMAQLGSRRRWARRGPPSRRLPRRR